MGYVEHAGHRGAARFWLLAVLCLTLVLGAPSVASGAAVSPLPESDYTTRNACAAPAPGHAELHGARAVAHTAAAQAQVIQEQRARPA